MRRLSSTLAALQTQQVAHRNISASSIVRTNDQQLRIMNFENASLIDEEEVKESEGRGLAFGEFDAGAVGNLLLGFATERKVNPFKEDMLSLGLVLLQLCTLCSLSELDKWRIAALQGDYEFLNKLNGMSLFTGFGKGLLPVRELFIGSDKTNVLHKNPRERPDFLMLKKRFDSLCGKGDGGGGLPVGISGARESRSATKVREAGGSFPAGGGSSRKSKKLLMFEDDEETLGRESLPFSFEKGFYDSAQSLSECAGSQQYQAEPEGEQSNSALEGSAGCIPESKISKEKLFKGIPKNLIPHRCPKHHRQILYYCHVHSKFLCCFCEHNPCRRFVCIDKENTRILTEVEQEATELKEYAAKVRSLRRRRVENEDIDIIFYSIFDSLKVLQEELKSKNQQSGPEQEDMEKFEAKVKLKENEL